MSVLSIEDWAFIDALTERLPYLRERFETALAVAPAARLRASLHGVSTVPRSGYVVRGVPEDEVESVLQHMQHAVALASPHFIDNASDREDVKAMLRVHDLPEWITLDLHKKAPVTSAEKKHLDALAAKVVFEAEPKHMRAYEEYEANETLNAHRAHDIDKIQILIRSIEYYHEYPHLAPRLDEFWDWYAAYPRETDTAQKLYAFALELRAQNTPAARAIKEPPEEEMVLGL